MCVCVCVCVCVRVCVCVCVVCVCEQATESSLKRMHQRMQEAEQRMMRDDVTADNMLQIVGTKEFSRPRGVLILRLLLCVLM